MMAHFGEPGNSLFTGCDSDRGKSDSRLRPIRESAVVEEGLSGPLAEVDGEGYAMAGVGACKDQVFVGWMGAEGGDEIFCEKDGAAPAMSDANFFQGRVKIADTIFEHF